MGGRARADWAEFWADVTEKNAWGRRDAGNDGNDGNDGDDGNDANGGGGGGGAGRR